MIDVEFRPVKEDWGEWRELVDRATGQSPILGDMYYAPWYLENNFERSGLAPHYWARPEPRRAPIVVHLPSKHGGSRTFCVDQMAYNSEQGWHGAGWTISGIEPRLTLSPSINLHGDYHGYLSDGVIADDVEGRSYP